MSELNKIIRTTQDAMDKVIAGTHESHTYNDDNMYQVELADPVILGATDSGATIDDDNNLIIDLRKIKLNGTALTITDGAVEIPIATTSSLGVVKPWQYTFTVNTSDNTLRINSAAANQIMPSRTYWNVITGANIDGCLKYALTDDVVSWLATETAAVRSKFGAGIPNTTTIDEEVITTETAEVLTQTEFNTKLAAGTLVKGVKYKIKGTPQELLVSGTNIKTINGNTILGSGNIEINSGVWGNITGTLSNQTDLNTALNGKSTVTGSETGTSTTEINYITITTNGTATEYKLAGGGAGTGAVRYDTTQSLTTAQKEQARTNIGLIVQVLDADD